MMAKHQDTLNDCLATDGYPKNSTGLQKNPDFKLRASSAFLALFLAVCMGSHSQTVSAESSSTKNFNIPASQLSKGLSLFAGQNGLNLSFDPALTEGKHTSGLKGEFGIVDGFHELLKDTGLQMVNDPKGGYFLEKIPVKQAPPVTPDIGHVDVELGKVKIRAKRFKQVGPMPGLELTKEQIAGNIQTLTAADIKKAHSLSLSDLMNTKLQSVNVNDYQGNPFQMDVTYRGFTASPQLGTPQGLSVFFDGIRVNEPFGDVVNWDMIPMNALGGFDIFPGSNPLFGLNTLGGALSMKTKSGFTSPGIEAEILAGSYGRKQLQASGGWNNANKEEGSWDGGNYAAFAAVNLFLEDGWRDNSPSKVNQAFGKFEWQGERASLSFSTLAAVNKLVGNGTIPQELYNEDAASIFTSPDVTKNKLLQFQIAGAFDVTDTFNVTGQIYQRNSDRLATTGDIIDQETFSNGTKTYNLNGTRLPGANHNGIQCIYQDTNSDGIPDYYTVTEANFIPYLNSIGSATGVDQSLITTDNSLPLPTEITLPNEVKNGLVTVFESGILDFLVNKNVDPSAQLPNGLDVVSLTFNINGVNYFDDSGNSNYIVIKPPVNASTCLTGFSESTPNSRWNTWMVDALPVKARDGSRDYDPNITGSGTGVIEGTPTGVITKTDIQQSTKGAAMQLNWNMDTHKFMVGASFDQSYASYVGKQRLAVLDDSRNVYNDPSQIGEEFWAGSNDVTINDFDGTSKTKSLYFSETWSPVQTLNLSVSGRYNYTDVKNNLAPSIAENGLQDLHLLNRYPNGVICSGNDISQCSYGGGPIPADVYEKLVAQYGPNSGIGVGVNTLDKRQSEAFNYHSFNPAIGATWQAKPNLNIYANWNQGTRTPSVIELGCAYDPTIITRADGVTGPRSIMDERGCVLPSSLSGDPYLPQVKARTMELGARGKFNDFLEWNVSAYRTNVTDDIYMVSPTQTLSFFQDIGDTRRQGIEFGLAGEYGKSEFRFNYSLTEATFESNFSMVSPYNSSRNLDKNTGADNLIQVQPGNVMPGVPFNNFNMSWAYKLTPQFKLGFNAVAHSRSFLRGNENNAHTPGAARVATFNNGPSTSTEVVPANNYPGTVPGYAVLNFNSRYDLGKGWAASLLVNNVLDKKYYTAGRLGLNPIAPSTNGLIGPGGFNYNSNEWTPSQFISPGAPRGMWVSLSYDFDASKKTLPSTSSITTEPDRTLEPARDLLSMEEVALLKQLDKIKALPILKSIQTAKQEVTANVEIWRKALAAGDTEAYVKSYTSSFAPARTSHNDWIEQQKVQFATDVVSFVETKDVVVAPQDKRMVAVFTQLIGRGGVQEAVRKVLTFEQKEGQWLIIRERNLPARDLALNSTEALKTSQTGMLSPKQKVAKTIKPLRVVSLDKQVADNVMKVEVK
jgi:outer membrane receptor protein involved in Fe transport